MSKRKNQDSRKSAPAAKKMLDQQGESSAPSPEEKIFVYHQGHIDVASLYLTTTFADVHFVFDSNDGTTTRIPAHRNLLVVTSDVFQKMFCGGLKESGDVKIVDASEAAFKEFLQFFYLNEVKLSTENVGAVLYLGNIYNVENCVEACVKFLTDDLSNENVCTALSLAILCDQEELAIACEKQVILNSADIFKSAGFSECSKEALAHILQMNQLVFSCSEVDIFEACMEWVRAKSQQRVVSKAMVDKYLGNLYYRIRFASMTIKEFCKLKTKYRTVLSSDFEAIIRLIERVDIDAVQFNTSPRQVEWNEGVSIKCDRDLCRSQDMWNALDIEEKTTFTTSAPLMLGKFTCNAIYAGETNPKFLRSSLSVEVMITEARTLDDVNGKVLCGMTANLGSLGTTVSLPHPILVRPDLFYTISIKGFPDCHCFRSCDQQSSIILKNSNIKIQFHNDKIVNGKITGMVCWLKFNKI